MAATMVLAQHERNQCGDFDLGRTHAAAEDADDAVPLAEPIQGFNGLMVRQTIRFGGNVVGDQNWWTCGRRACRIQHPPDSACARNGRLSSIR
jgi:hypothetical protein